MTKTSALLVEGGSVLVKSIRDTAKGEKKGE